MTKTDTEFKHSEEAQRLCATLNTMGKFKVYGNDAKSEKLSFTAYKPFATEQSTDFVADCLRKIGFTDVLNDKGKKDFFHSVSATIVCEYDLNTRCIKKSNTSDIKALCYMFDYMRVWCTIFLPTETGREELPFWKHKSDLQNYLFRNSNEK
jgi:hypothetical protein